MRRKALGTALALALLVTACGGGGGGKKKKSPPPVNNPPTLNAIPTPQQAIEGQLRNVLVSATDPEGDPLSFVAFPLPANATFTDNGNGTADFDFTPDPTQTGSMFTVTFEVSDGNNAAVTQDVVFQVVPPPNLPPTLTAIPSPQTAIAGGILAFTVTANDPESDPLTLTAVPLPTNATFTDNGNGTGDFSFSPTFAQCGSQSIVVFSADDGTNPAVTQNVQLDVSSDSPILNPIPTPRQVPEGNTVTFTVRATDPNGDTLTMSAAPLPPGGGFFDNGDGTGDFTFTPGGGTAGTTYTVTFSADDTCSTPVTQDVDLEVILPNLPPVLNPIATPQAVSHGATLTIPVSATDPDGDPITFGVTPAVPNVTVTGTGPGMADVVFTPGFEQSGSFRLTVQAFDPFNPPGTQVVQVDVSGNGDGTFTEVPTPIPGPYATTSWGMATADLDADGNADLISLDSSAGTAGLVILLGNGDGTFTVTAESPYSLPAPASADPVPRHVTVADYDNDGALDVALAARADGDLHIFLGDGGATPDGTFTYHAPGLLQFGTDNIFHMLSWDFDEDGNTDIVACSAGAPGAPGNFKVLLGDGTGAFSLSSQSPFDTSTGGGMGTMHAGLGDMNGDGIMDIVAVNLTDNMVRVYFGDDDGTGVNSGATFTEGAGSFSASVPSPSQPSIADFNNDGALDIGIPHFEATAFFTIWLGNGFGLFNEAAARPALGSQSEYSATGDFDGDGNADLVGTNTGGNEVHVYLGDGTGLFTAATGSPFVMTGNGRVVVVNDFDNDDISDIAATAADVGGLHVYLGN